MKEFITVSSLFALIFSVVLFFFAPLGGIGFIVGIILLTYFIAIVIMKLMWSLAGTADDALSGVIHGDQ